MRRRLIDCAHCGRTRPHHSRGLCTTCGQGYNGCDPQDYERKTWPSELLVDEWALLARQGCTRRQAAERLGISKKRLEKAIERQTRTTREVAA